MLKTAVYNVFWEVPLQSTAFHTLGPGTSTTRVPDEWAYSAGRASRPRKIRRVNTWPSTHSCLKMLGICGPWGLRALRARKSNRRSFCIYFRLGQSDGRAVCWSKSTDVRLVQEWQSCTATPTVPSLKGQLRPSRSAPAALESLDWCSQQVLAVTNYESTQLTLRTRVSHSLGSGRTM